MPKNLDKIRGCLLGGAAGDALGYEVEFLPEYSIFNRYGKPGITEYALHAGLARISDDTQMTLFTANGLLLGATRARPQNFPATLTRSIAQAYRDWYSTQTQRYDPPVRPDLCCWLMDVPELYAGRAPGITCMTAIADHCRGSVAHPANQSKGCGGVMRVAPIGLYFDEGWTDQTVDLLGAEAAALTHGHEMGYIPAALLVHIVRALALGDAHTPRAAVLEGLDAMDTLFPGAEHLPEFRKLIEKSIALTSSATPDLDAIHALGQGWVGDEALAIAIFCALRYEDDFDRALIAAVNHEGDSDSTGAITGNILGVHLGLSRIPEKYKQNLELSDVILEMADDLYFDCPETEFDPRTDAWRKKYLQATRV